MTTDFERNVRVYNEAVDIGAYEYTVTYTPLSGIILSTNTPKVGTTITTALNPNGATAKYQWYRGTSATEITTAISDATSSSYTVTSSDIGSYLKVVATGTGNYTEEVNTATTAVVPSQEPLVNTAVGFCTTPSTGDLSVFLPEQKVFVQKGQNCLRRNLAPEY